jgi:Glycosyl transferase family 11
LKIISIKFNGGLGNQLFQYAHARSFMKHSDKLIFDTSSYNNDYLNRNFKLELYNVKGSILSSKRLIKFFSPKTLFNKVINFLGLFLYLEEEGFFFQGFPKSSIKFITSIKGYWQTDLYFSSIRISLIKEITPKFLPPIPNILIQNNVVAVHVRRTDYLKDDRYGFLGLDYYKNAIEYFNQKLINPAFYFFSDDMDWCKENFTNENMFFCEDELWKEDYLQLYLISKCTHQIIANSSFSWWGAWLNENEKKIVVRPNKPFNDGSLCYENHYPPQWIGI